MNFQSAHAKAYAKMIAANAVVIVFAWQARVLNPANGTFGAPVDHTMAARAIGMPKGDPATYTKLGLIFSEAPTLFVVCANYGDEPPPNASLVWDGVTYFVRDVAAFKPGARMVTANVVIAR